MTFEVLVRRTDFYSTVVSVEAKNRAEAKSKVDAMIDADDNLHESLHYDDCKYELEICS